MLIHILVDYLYYYYKDNQNKFTVWLTLKQNHLILKKLITQLIFLLGYNVGFGTENLENYLDLSVIPVSHHTFTSIYCKKLIKYFTIV